MPWDETVRLCDVSLHRGGPFEDRRYASYPLLRMNIKRGNSVCLTETSEPFFIRRG